MPRNLDLTALRSFVAVADAGGVTRAAGFLNLTQSAVSMQIKRLEDSLGLSLFDRGGRGVALTPPGEQLLGYARRMLLLNDEAWARLTDKGYEGEIVLGVPHDILHPVIPRVLARFSSVHPRMQVRLISANTLLLKEEFARGAANLILTTEDVLEDEGSTLSEVPLRWIGAREGTAFRHRPLRIAFSDTCIFRGTATAALDAAGIPWEPAVSTTQIPAIEAVVSADLAVCAMLEGTWPAYMEPVLNGALPPLGTKLINLYVAGAAASQPCMALAEMIREGYRRHEPARLVTAAE